jgi:hypothetical protein
MQERLLRQNNVSRRQELTPARREWRSLPE